ncbi:MAG: cobalamin-dependent protein [Jatrophihabitans sp.]|uniref:cobalamin-dependent protein n=1 Tax=Jatrophihabitans sp. TaxID=1932789 RepID=UPI003F7E021B
MNLTEYWAALEEGDAQLAVKLAERALEDGEPLLDVLDVVCAAQAEVGRLWAADEWNIAQEHRATSISEEVVDALANRVQPTERRGSIVITCADGEWHALPSRVLSTAFRGSGYAVTFLGASVPARHLAQLLHEVGPDVTAISCALATRLPAAREMIEASRGAGIPVLIGGRGFGTDGRWGLALGANAWAPDARSAVRLVERGGLPVFVTPPPRHRAPADVLALLRRRRTEIVHESLQRMMADVPTVARYNAYQRGRAEEDLEHILDFLAAALYVDDASVFTEFIDWLREVLTARGVPTTTLVEGLQIVSAVLASEAGPYDRALDILRLGAELLQQPDAKT